MWAAERNMAASNQYAGIDPDDSSSDDDATIDTREWPDKYGRLDDDIEGRSGYSPTEVKVNAFPGAPVDADLDKLDRRREEKQKKKFLGFTTREFVDLDVYTKRGLLKGDLPHTLHPLITRNRWLGSYDCPHVGTSFPLPDGPGLTGTWSAHNDLVWEVIQPALRIFTQMLSKVLEIEWVNLPTARKNSIAKSQFLAITTSVRYSIPNGRKQWKDVGKDLLQYDYQKSMTPQQANVARNVLLRIVNAMDEDDCGDLTWGIKADKVDPFNGSVDDNCGFTTLKNGTIYVFLDSRLISPLLRDDLTDCERMAGDYYLANTVLHEFGHALWMAVCIEDTLPKYDEPYFEDNAIAEVGFTMEMQCFKAIPVTMYNSEELQPCFGLWLETDDQTVQHATTTNEPVLRNPKLAETNKYYPIKSTFYQNIQQTSFWNTGIKTFGISILHIESLKEGVLVDYIGTWTADNVVKGFPKGANPVRISETVNAITAEREKILATIKAKGLRMTAEERANYLFGWSVVQNAIWDDLFWEKQQEMKQYKETVMQSINYMIKGRPASERHVTLNELLTFINNSGTQHEQLIDPLLRSEANQNIRFDERHDNLIIWNRGQRIYAKEILAMVKRDPSYFRAYEFEDAIVSLNVCRMLLWHPGEDSDLEGTERETNLIGRLDGLVLIRGYDAANISANNEVFSRADSTLFLEAVTQIILSHLPPNVQGLQESYDLVYRGHGLLQRLSTELQAIPKFGPIAYGRWSGELTTWIQRAEQRQDEIRQLAAEGSVIV